MQKLVNMNRNRLREQKERKQNRLQNIETIYRFKALKPFVSFLLIILQWYLKQNIK